METVLFPRTLIPLGFTSQKTKEQRMFISTRISYKHKYAQKPTSTEPRHSSSCAHFKEPSPKGGSRTYYFPASLPSGERSTETESYFIAESSTKAEKENHLRTELLKMTGLRITGFLDFVLRPIF
jgi:hypothetical protein